MLGTDRKTEVSLYENLGKVTIIDFWASWCKPCRVENPNMVKLYEKYKDKGLKIIGVSLDTDEERWKEAIEKDGLPWIHVASLVKDDPTADMYNVEYIPTIYILNEKGIILAKNVYGEELDENIGKLLN
ncbi:peroxiredoxin family protein [Capnocytophaga sp. ARDL2]|uniref:peroxiredoxin family protein n=1 Tax=Capnocytophaga sp. ARDL2 TaxID=3238809 RepID=UPI00355751FD